ncbi:methyl-accepting chemotaxis protein [Methylobacillus methanolivorans]|uniref:Methyl-accepting chemotaxis protein n=1 Tax=Methylobacillus methanolivorans TaxID=1848927 RepID=A0ABW8GKF9_9PROT
MKFSDWKVGTRLGAGFAVILFLLISIVGMGVMQLSVVGKAAKQVTADELPKERLAQEWLSNVKQNGIRIYAALMMQDDVMVAMYKKQIAETVDINNELSHKLESSISNPEAKLKFADVQEKFKAFSSHRDELMKLRDQRAIDAATMEQRIRTELLPAREVYFAAMEDFVAFERGVIDTAGDQIQDVKNSSSLWFLVLGAIALGLGIFSALRLSQGITRPIADAVKLAETVASGDLTATVKASSKDEIGQLLQALGKMNDNLAKIVADVRHGTESIATSAGEIANGNLDLSSRTEEQASSLEETASAMEELTSTVKQNADNARQANQLAASASSVAVQGGQVVDQVISTMGTITESSKRISDIIGVIDGIAFQTNILALNAAVEAARAGEQGRGFAVVASEVRNLAQRSANAAKEIKGLITDSVESVEAGSKLVAQAGATITEVVESVRRVTDIVSEISAASAEQSTGIEQINQAVVQMDEVTQQNAALVEEAAAASQAMQDQSNKLEQLVSVFKVSGGQARTVTEQAPKPRPRPVAMQKPKPKLAASSIKAVGNAGAGAAAVVAGDEWTEF